MFEVAPFFTERKEEQEASELFRAVVVEFVNNHVIKSQEKTFEQVALVYRTVSSEVKNVVEDVWIYDNSNWFPTNITLFLWILDQPVQPLSNPLVLMRCWQSA